MMLTEIAIRTIGIMNKGRGFRLLILNSFKSIVSSKSGLAYFHPDLSKNTHYRMKCAKSLIQGPGTILPALL